MNTCFLLLACFSVLFFCRMQGNEATRFAMFPSFFYNKLQKGDMEAILGWRRNTVTPYSIVRFHLHQYASVFEGIFFFSTALTCATVRPRLEVVI